MVYILAIKVVKHRCETTIVYRKQFDLSTLNEIKRMKGTFKN